MSSKRSRLLAALLVLALVASACGGGDDDESSSAGGDSSSAGDSGGNGGDSGDDAGSDTGAGADETATGEELTTDEGVEKQSGGVLRIGMEAEPTALNPTNTPLAITGVMMGQAIFDTLTVWDENDQWANNLSESWTPSADFTSWEMKIRDGITFTDGEVMDADAVLQTLNAQLADPFIGLVFRPTFDPDTPFEKVDDMTIRINTLGPNSNVPSYFTTQLGMIASPAWLDAAADDPSLDQEPVGAGPFMIEERTQDFKTRMVPNPNWWRDDEIYLDAVEFFPLQQESSRTDQLLSGELDMLHATDVDSILRLRDEPDISRVEDDSGEEFNILLNSAEPPFDDIRVRQAATHAFPEEAYESLIRRGVTERADNFFAESLFWHAPDVVQPTGQPELAAPLIEEYCGEFPENCTGGKVDIEYQHNGPSLSLDQIADVVGNGWEPFFNVTVQVIPQDQHINEVAFGLYDAATWRYHGQLDPDVEVAFWSCASIGGLSINWTRNCNEERDALMAQQRTTDDPDERYAIWADIQRNLQESFAYIIISRNNWVIAAASNVNGVCDATTPEGTKMRCVLNGGWRLPQIWLSQ